VFATKYPLWEKYPCVLMGNPQWVDGVVLFQSNRVNMVFEERQE
jgi:hypothetical protein